MTPFDSLTSLDPKGLYSHAPTLLLYNLVLVLSGLIVWWQSDVLLLA